MSKVTINGVELELDLMDADVVEEFDNLNAEIAAEIKNPEHYEGLSNADCMRVQCRMIESYFEHHKKYDGKIHRPESPEQTAEKS